MSAQTINVLPAESVRGDRLAGLLWDRKMNLKELAQRAGMNNTALSQKLHGHRRWYLGEVARIAEVLSTSVAFLIGEADEPERSLTSVDPVEWAEYQLWRARRDSNSQPSDP